MKLEESLEDRRLSVLREYESIHLSNRAAHGPGTVNIAQVAMVAELCAANLSGYVVDSYSVMLDPELFRLAIIASDAVDELNSAMQDRLRPQQVSDAGDQHE
ncbi:hypothetical protein QE369_001207 [Agrobacterium larrymoorei]|uniref:Uncharacterized protein n=1 Tax=Agrobacterium larrymoorei TaxID=160699 RepID=A0AAJ2BDR5_9HYPH|nr:hypothetical protein [Agrobacterium larrymoorei]MDR6101029.1 hypothetical protein [Agrobacterium larrymoorei]